MWCSFASTVIPRGSQQSTRAACLNEGSPDARPLRAGLPSSTQLEAFVTLVADSVVLEDAITGRAIESVPYAKDFERRRARLRSTDDDAIVAALTAVLDQVPIGRSISASWIPSADWTGTVYMPIYADACGHNFEAAALFFGNLLKCVVIGHHSNWRSIKQPKSKKDPDSIQTTLYWRVD